MTFFGESRVSHEAEHHLHESPASMTVPLMILAALSVVGGWIGWPESLGGSDTFAHFLDPVIAKHAEAAAEKSGGYGTEYALMLASVLVAVFGIWLARRLYLQHPDVPERLAERFSGVYRLLYNKYYVDQIYDAMFVNRTKDLATGLGAFDRGVIDGLGINGAGWLTRALSRVSMVWDSWVVDGLVNLAARIAWVLSIPVRMLQSGRVGSYALFIVLGVMAGLAYYLHVTGITFHSVLH
jgi:NADH-quinone oxidoreductase subunit L